MLSLSMVSTTTMGCLGKLKNYLKEMKGFLIAAMLLLESAMEDVVLTLENISKYGIEVEGNPILRETAEHLGVVPGLLVPKILASGIAIYTAHKMNKINYVVKGEYFLYMASICWLYGAVAHLLLN